jgi:hypothetical protein
MRDNAVIAPTPTGPVAYVTTRTGFAAHLHTAQDVADFTTRHPWATDLLEDYLKAEAASGRRRGPSGAACTVEEALAMTRQTARRTA